MDNKEVVSLAEVAGNDKRLFILRQLYAKTDLTWSQIVAMVDKEFNIRVNPNTVSFHLKYLIDRDYVRKVGSHYILNDHVRPFVLKLVE